MNKLVPLALSGCVIAGVCGFNLSRDFYEFCARAVFFSLTLASVAIVFVHVRPAREFWQLVVLVGGMALLQVGLLGVPIKWGALAGNVGISSLGLLAIRRVWSTPEQRRLLHYALLPSFLFALLGFVGPSLLTITGKLHPKTLDLFLYVFDGTLGFNPSFALAKLVLRSGWLIRALVGLYFLLPAALMFVYSKQLIREIDFAMQGFLAFLVAGPLGVIFYNIFPACGPIYLVGRSFPSVPPSLQQLNHLVLAPVAIAGPRNAFPSLHLAWALLAWQYSVGTSAWARRFTAMFLAGTALATLAMGEHYFVDLVVAFPFALAVGAVCRFDVAISKWYRWGSILSGLSLVLGWAALLRFAPRVGLISPIVPWTLIACTLGSCMLLQSQLQKLPRPEINQVDV